MTVISDDVGEFEKAVQGSQLARGRILDWFHIAIKFKAEQRSVFGSKMIASLERESVETEITNPKWLKDGRDSQLCSAEHKAEVFLVTDRGPTSIDLSMRP
ncbi:MULTISPECIES: hypothetical protein [Paraburkholderia]|uniref:Uncharacterized protein n=1 Tax=Paraburkholderia madseniana TaxID=2599607 RepID=A0A6N6W9Y1_9BURK|nr:MULTISPECIES: hypothetical protein [Paraburkholderia]KAE8757273.1 hypothetical protein FSO04_24700 [Paraburkholderia madseniana]MCX4145256.1 hypothetical protein [Paraburkholderia madseniana]MDN7148206.1 hypothetical protein [Paraburkholderia sp. WS6]MDQ6407086.1 hypothetical protein [Paraburkholderia madseniana]